MVCITCIIINKHENTQWTVQGVVTMKYATSLHMTATSVELNLLRQFLHSVILLQPSYPHSYQDLFVFNTIQIKGMFQHYNA